MKNTYRKNSIEARLDALLPAFPSFDVIAHNLYNDGGGWSANDSWHLGRDCDRETAISHLAARWEIFKINYHKKATIKNIQDMGDEYSALLDADCIPFAEVRNAATE